jgi:SdrD B-like domain/Right handed beta helix region/Putative Ig domain/Domain of unknown function (DUF4214)
MFFSSFSRSSKRSSPIRTKSGRSLKPRAPVHLLLERLEDRLAPAVVVTRTSDNATFTSIQAAINDAGTVTGTTLLVSAGTDAEQVNINKSIILEGAQHGVDARTRSGAETIVTGTGNSGDTPFNITANNVTIDGFTVEDATNSNVFGFGIVESAGTSGAQILNNIIQDNIAGLSLANNPTGNAGLIQHNLFQDNNQTGPISGTAIYTDQFNAGGNLANVTIDANTFSNNQNVGVLIGSTDAATSTATNLTISNNTFNTEGNAVLLFNTTSSSIKSNTITNSLDSQVVIGGGVNGLQVTGNLIQNGATIGINVGDFGGGSANQNVTVSLNNIQGNDSAGLSIDNSGGTAYTGTLNAMFNWWGDISGPTIASNVGGLGQTIIDPNNQVVYRTWLIYGTDADTIAPGFQLPTTIDVTEGGDISPADNDYTRLANAIGSVQSGQTLVLSGTFDWTKPFSSAAWALGNDGVSGTDDDYTITAPIGVSSVTVTSASLGGATIQGPGSLANSGILNPIQLPTFLALSGGPDQDWTISNLQIFDFNIGLEFGNPATQTDFNGTTITNNHIVVPQPQNQTVDPNAFPENFGLNFSWGANQTISNNQIDLYGGGSSDTTNMNLTGEVGIESNTSGGNVYNGLKITGNTVNVLHAQSADPEHITGIWENGGANTSNITVSGNQFINEDPANNPTLNVQIAFRLTSASSATTTILYQNNSAAGAHVGFQYYPTYDNTGTQPVQLIDNTLTNVFNGFDFANGAKSVNYLSGNSAKGVGGAGTGIAVGAGSTVTTDGVSGTNTLSGFATGVDVNGGTATLQQNTIFSNSVGVSVENSGSLTAALQNFIRNNTGAGISIAANAGTIGAVTDNDLSGNTPAIANASAALIDASLNWWGSNTRAGVQAAISGSVDYTPFLNSGTDTESASPGFQGDFSILNVDSQSPQSGAVGRIQEGVNDVLAGGTVNVLSGTYAENVTIAKNLTLAGFPANSLTAIVQPASGDGITITAPATNVTVENLEVTGAANGVNASGVATVTLQNLELASDSTGLAVSNLTNLNLSDLTLTGNTTAGGTIGNVTTLNYTPLTGSTGAASTITGSSFQRGSDQAVNYSGVPTFNVIGSDGSDTFNVTPSASTTFTVNGGLPNPPALPGDTLNVAVAGTTNPTLNATFNSATGYSGSWTFGNADPINFAEIETLVPGPPAITSGNTATFIVGQANTFQVTTSATPTASLTETGALPSGVTFIDNGNGTATLAGMPNADTGGIYTFTITAANGFAPNATQNFTLTVNEAPTITSSNAATFTVGQASTFIVTTGHDFPTATSLTETGALPSGVTFTDNGNGTATLAGMPSAGTGGIYTFTITAANGIAPNATQNFTLTVNEAPTITSGNAATFLVGKSSTFTVTTGHDFPTATTLSETGALPSGVTFTDNGNGTATLAGIPSAAGTFTFTITAANGVAPSATQTFTLATQLATVQFGAETQTSSTFSVPIVLSTPLSVDTTIPFTVGGTAGVSGVTASPLVIPAGQTSGTITGTFTDGGFGGSSQTVTITLGTPTNAAVTGTNPLTFSESTPLSANIEGTVFFDYNDNGTLDPGDTGLGGRTVYLDLNNDGTLDPGDPTAVTDANGNYVFTAVANGSYTVREDVIFTNVIQTGPAGNAYHITLAGTAATGLNFGNFQNQSVAPVEVNTNLFGSGSNTDANTAYIRGLYFALLGRDANRQLPQSNGTSISEVQYWLNQLNSGMTRDQVAQAIVDSQEHRGLEVDSYYETYLHRSESAAEQAFWVNVFESGADEATVVEGFLDSQEYQLEHVSDSSYVQDLYIDVLGRFGSASELTAQEAALASGVSRQALAQMFVQSDELDQLAVTSFYGAYLHRAPDPKDVFWLNMLQSGQSLGAVQAGILGDPFYQEFFNDGAATVQ